MNAGTSTDTTAGGSVISLPQGGGAVNGLGEKFSPDLFTGTGNSSVPIQVPAGRHGVQPQLSLGYSTGNGNGPFGLGWALSMPGVSRRTSHGLPRYRDVADAAHPEGSPADVFILSGAEDLVPVAAPGPGRVRYRPRTEGLFARIEHVTAGGDFWEVRTREGLTTLYGTPGSASGQDPAVVADPGDPGRIFGWRITKTSDLLGNQIRYEYLADAGDLPPHRWDHPLLRRISYADYGDPAAPSFLVTVEFEYEARPDAFSVYRAGFEVRATQRCHLIRVSTHAGDGITRAAREYRFGYQQAAFNGASLLTQVNVVGIDDQALAPGQDPATEHLPPLTFGYSGFDPAGRRFEAVIGPGLPTAALSNPALALADLRGAGLPDVIELGAAPRVWRNAGGGRFELPRQLAEAPPFSLADPGVQLMDADGDGRPDLVVPATTRGGRTAGATAGYFPMTFAGGWSRRSFQPYRQSPSVRLADLNVKPIDLDGDGLTDVLRSGTRLECWFNDPDPRLAWQRTAVSDGTGPAVDLADPRVRLADMTGDGLHDIVLLRNGNIAYWPNLGYGRWGPQVTMRRSPRLPDGYDPRRVLLGDLDGDGAADLIYVDHGRVLLWGNQSGNAWTGQPVTISGTPGVADTDALQLSDLHGTGMAGLLFSRAADGSGRPYLRFLDFNGGVKPHLLEVMDNHLGATTRVTYAPSTQEYLRDQADPATRWRTTLPFPVQVVSHVEVTDAFSHGRLSTEYRYHHGYWDGVEREFRGFGMVEQLDTEAFGAAPSGGPGSVPATQYSPPTLTRRWFHPGPVAAVEAGDWTELDFSHEYWDGDEPMLARPEQLTMFLRGLPRSARRAALRALRGQLLRSELYALDGTDRQDLPYTVTESICGVREESPPAGQPDDVRERIFFPFILGQRTTQWERGDDPMTRFAFTGGYDEYGLPAQTLAMAVPRGRDPLRPGAEPALPYLATLATVGYARRDDAGHYLVDRVATRTRQEVVDDGSTAVPDLRDAVLAGRPDGYTLRLLEYARTYFDGPEFVGLPLGQLGEHGLPVRIEFLAMTDDFFTAAEIGRPDFLDPAAAPADRPAEFGELLPPLAGDVHYADADLPGGYYVTTVRHRYDVHDPTRTGRGLPLAWLDPLGARYDVEYDQHDLLPVRTVDPAGLVTEASHDYRTLLPRAVTDVNGNISEVRYSPAALVTARFIRGKDGTGDRDAPSVVIDHDLRAYAERGQPVSVRTTRRVHHDTAVPASERDAVIVAAAYSDGFGRLLQTRTQAPDVLFGDRPFGAGVLPGDLTRPGGVSTGQVRDPTAPPNVLVSGLQTYDNKGRVVERYEPFCSTGFDYTPPLDAELGRKVVMHYDPRGELVRTVHPDSSEQLVVLGVPVDLADPAVFAPTPWESFHYDANDNAGRTHPDTAAGYAEHWNTPGNVELDALGRTVTAVARKGADPAAWLTTRTAYDIRGNLLSSTDPLGRVAVGHHYDLAGRRWRTDGIDSGRRELVPNAAGDPVLTSDGQGAAVLTAYDLLRRPVRRWARDGAGDPFTLRQRLEYGDGGDPGQDAGARGTARAANLLGRLTRHYDEAGLATVIAADLRGNPLETGRRVIADAPVLATYAKAVGADWQVPPFRVDWTPGHGQSIEQRADELLEPAGYATTAGYDALDRVTRLVLPTDITGHRAELMAGYDPVGRLERLTLDGTAYLERVGYDALGRRSFVAFGNGTMTRYAFDPFTFRPVRMRTEAYTSDGAGYHPAGPTLQDCGYSYDLVGNLLVLSDRTPGSGIPGDALDRQFGYDPIYQLVSTTGRERAGPTDGDPWADPPRGTDPAGTEAYTETYRYERGRLPGAAPARLGRRVHPGVRA